MIKISIPGKNENSEIEFESSLVIIGSNGSGKSRLGSFIENSLHNDKVKRISAQRMLNLPENTPILTESQAIQNWKNNWTRRQVIEVQNDYESVISTLFAKKSKRNNEYVEKSKLNDTGKQLDIPNSDLETLVEIWDKVFQHIKLDFTEDKVMVLDKDGNKYLGREMSDGERVAFYLIAQCLIIPRNNLIIIDEPELHLHKSLMNRLWNEIENTRQDCKFIYITHDLDFASGRTTARKIWIRSFQNNKWEWSEVPNLDFIPESLLLEIIGSRKPILFIEGENNSLDYRIYQHIFTNFTIIPRGGNKDVIQSTKGINNNKDLHFNKAYGLIDRDQKNDEEVKVLENDNIFTIEFAEIENFLATPVMTNLVANQLGIDYNEVENKIIDLIIEDLKTNIDKAVSFRTSLEVCYKFNTLNLKAIGIEGIKKEMQNLIESIETEAIYESNYKLYSEISDSKELNKILKYYTNKGLVSKISSCFNQNVKGFTDLAISVLKNKSRESKNEIGLFLSKQLIEINNRI